MDFMMFELAFSRIASFVTLSFQTIPS